MQLIQSYLEALTRDAIRTTPNGPFFFTGGEKNKKFSNSPMGINSLRDVPKQIAAFLDLPDAKGYTGHCFRRYFFAARYYLHFYILQRNTNILGSLSLQVSNDPNGKRGCNRKSIDVQV